MMQELGIGASMVVNFSNTESSVEAEKRTFTDKANDFLLRFTKVPLKEKLFFVQHLGLMLKSGISLSRALKTLGDQSQNPRFKRALLEISGRVEKGSTFSESLAYFKDIFGELFINMIEAGELSGKLESVMSQLHLQMKKEHALISKVKGALTYPAVVIFAMGGIGTFMMIVVMPKITAMFEEVDVELPLATKILIGTSKILRENGIMVAIGLVAFIYIAARILKTRKGKYIFQAILLKTPIFSDIVKKINLARFSRNVSSLLKTDIMIIKTFQITASVLGNLHYREAIEDMAQAIKKGGKINETINMYPHLFPPVVAQMVAIGEETGELDNILIELAEFYEEEIDQIMENLPSIIEPLLILILGVGIGGIAIAVVTPMLKLSSAI